MEAVYAERLEKSMPGFGQSRYCRGDLLVQKNREAEARERRSGGNFAGADGGAAEACR